MTETPSRFRRIARATAINGALLAGSLVFAVVAAEVAIRVAAPQQLIMLRPDVWQPADTVGWLRRANVQTEMNTGERTVSVRTDSAGFRVGAAGRVEAGLPVLLLGDSFMEALQVEYEQSLAGLLQERLPEAVGLPIAVRNAGITGWGPSQYFLRARSLIPRDQYRLVIVAIFIGNDLLPVRLEHVAPRVPMERNRFHLPASLSRRELIDAFLSPLNDALETRSHLFVFTRTRLATLRMRAGFSPLYMPPEFRRTEVSSKRWEIASGIAEDIAELTAAHGARSLFVLIPAPFQVDERVFEQYLRGFGIDPDDVDIEQPTRLLSDQLASRGLDFVDALPAFRTAHNNGVRLYGIVDPHLTADGHALLADLLVPIASRMLPEGQ
jgi:hypothetical protein